VLLLVQGWLLLTAQLRVLLEPDGPRAVRGQGRATERPVGKVGQVTGKMDMAVLAAVATTTTF
jgi:hypothetical protein